jgi:hypothetical protein
VARLAQTLSRLAVAGIVFGYGVALAEWARIFSTPFAVLYGYALLCFPLAAATIILINRAFRKDFPLNRTDSLRKIVRHAPACSKVLAGAGVLVAVAAPLLFLGGSVHVSIEEWHNAEPKVRAVFYLSVAVPWCLSLLGLQSVASHRGNSGDRIL